VGLKGRREKLIVKVEQGRKSPLRCNKRFLDEPRRDY
jgi:hypothetical protein